jgi:hypothetical protein
MMRFRPFLTFALVVMMLATSITMAVARGQVRVGEQIVICSGYGLATIEVDAEGNPIGPVHICPECTLHFLAFLDAVPPSVARPATAARTVAVAQVAVPLSRVPATTRARGPPERI